MLLLRACLRSGGSGASARIVSRKLTSPPTTSAKLSSLSLSASSASTPAITATTPSSSLLDVRKFSSSSGGDDGDNDKSKEDQSFFLQNESALPIPPSYVRDSVTGKWTDKTHAELSSKDRKLLKLDEDAKGEEVMARLGEKWKEASAEAVSAEGAGDDGFGSLNKEHERVARRIQEQNLALGTIGREPADAIKKEENDIIANGDDGSDRPLTSREYQALKTYAEKEHGVNPKDFTRMADEEAIPHNTISSGSDAGMADSKQFFDADLDLAYLNPRLNRRAFKDGGGSAEDDDPFADLLPSDFNPQRKVNRKHAKPIPKRLLHHNNLSLLRRYTTPGGKIMNRVQSRLGAKDQRKIANLVKRARHMGLIPHIGQWKFEDHGYLHERGLESAAEIDNVGKEAEGKRDWELELEERGLWPLQNETELVKRYYDMPRMMDHIAGPRGEGNKKRAELEELLGGLGALVPDDSKKEEEDGK